MWRAAGVGEPCVGGGETSTPAAVEEMGDAGVCSNRGRGWAGRGTVFVECGGVMVRDEDESGGGEVEIRPRFVVGGGPSVKLAVESPAMDD